LHGLKRVEMETSINDFASVAYEYYPSERARREKVIPALKAIFSCYAPQKFALPSIMSSSTSKVRTDGHTTGPAQTPEMILEIKNEEGCGADAEVQLSSYYTKMHMAIVKAKDYEKLFNNSLLPALGISIVGKS
jgi:hypothetical protein